MLLFTGQEYTVIHFTTKIQNSVKNSNMQRQVSIIDVKDAKPIYYNRVNRKKAKTIPPSKRKYKVNN